MGNGWKKWLQRTYRSIKLGKKIGMMVMTAAVFSIGAVLVISYTLSAAVIREQAEELYQKKLDQNANYIESTLNTYEAMLDELCDSTYVEKLRKINQLSGQDYYEAALDFQDKFMIMTQQRDDIYGVAAVGAYGGECYYDALTCSGVRSCVFGEELVSYAALSRREYTNQFAYSELTVREAGRAGETECFYIIRRVVDNQNVHRRLLGYYVLCVNEKVFAENYETGATEGGEELTFLMNAEGGILSFPQSGYAQQQVEGVTAEASEEALADAVGEFAVRCGIYDSPRGLTTQTRTLRGGALYIADIQNMTGSFGRLRYILILNLIFASSIVLLCLLISSWISEDTEKVVCGILEAMTAANKGDLTVQIPRKGEDEFAEIADNFNRMVVSIRESNEQSLALIAREKDAEIRSLESQINPHFIYNTLDSINWMLIDRQEYEVARFVTDFAQILRYSIHDSNGLVTVDTEVAFLKKFIHLHQQRASYSFDCELLVDELARHYQLHKLLIQPLVENAILHGFEEGADAIQKPARQLRVEIQLREEEPCLYVMVQDNGKGMPPQLLSELQSYSSREGQMEHCIGIRNVITRLHLYYGAKGRMTFFSAGEGMGTRIEMYIPAEPVESKGDAW